mgnify:FL=1
MQELNFNFIYVNGVALFLCNVDIMQGLRFAVLETFHQNCGLIAVLNGGK